MLLSKALHDSPLPRLDTELLLEDLTGMSRTELYLNPDVEVDPDEYFARRLNGEPIQYITGKAYFRGHEIKVTPDVLIPRPETEYLVELAMKFKPKKVLDLCTGSGCIAVAFAKETNAEVFASDISVKALEVAEENCRGLNVKFIQSDMGKKIDEEFDLVISNPPYIPSSELKTLPSEVKDYEPMLALDGGEDGLKFLNDIFDIKAKHYAIELHEEAIKNVDFPSTKDLAGKNRYILI